MDDTLQTYKYDTSRFLRTLGDSLSTIADKQKNMASTISGLNQITKAHAQEKLADDLSELSSEVLKLAKNAKELAQKQNFLAQEDQNGKSE